MKTVTVNIEKYQTPVIWLDTCIFIDVGKLAAGDNLPKIQSDRISRLIKIIKEKVKLKKLICVEADQREEIEVGKTNLEVTYKEMISLSQGIQVPHRVHAKYLQLSRAMKSYLDQEFAITLPAKDFFYRDPIKELNERRNFPFVIRLNTSKNQQSIDDHLNIRNKIMQEIEQIRLSNCKNNISFGVQYKLELLADYTILRNHIDKITLHPALDDLTISEQLELVDPIRIPLSYWNKISKTSGDFDGLLQFFSSKHYISLPTVNIASSLYAHLLVGQQIIRHGDSMDVQHLSTILPYCQYVVTDKAMANRVKQLKLDQKWNTQVYCLSEYDELIATLETL